MKRPARQTGLSLVELLVTLTLSLLLLAGLTRIVIGGKESQKTQNALASLQESGRHLLQSLGDEARMAGYAGCSPIINNLLDTASADYDATLFDLATAVDGWNYSGTAPGNGFTQTTQNPNGLALNSWRSPAGGDLAADFQNDVVQGSDLLVVKRADQRIDIALATGVTRVDITTPQVDLDEAGEWDLNPDNAAQSFAASTATQKKDRRNLFLLLSSCASADLFQNCGGGASDSRDLDRSAGCNNAAGTALTPGNRAAVWSAPITQASELHGVRNTVFYIGRNPADRPALYRKIYRDEAGETAEELAEGVESLQLRYGIDTDNDGVANSLVSADGIGTHPVVTIEIALLLVSADDIKSQPAAETFDLAGTQFTSLADRKLRKVVSTVIKLRNRGRFDG
ncbi:MAG TPA: PilW family protein [Pseudomonadales bacterium]|nr:PilW family protein [Pseudomonadales bacterium]